MLWLRDKFNDTWVVTLRLECPRVRRVYRISSLLSSDMYFVMEGEGGSTDELRRFTKISETGLGSTIVSTALLSNIHQMFDFCF